VSTSKRRRRKERGPLSCYDGKVLDLFGGPPRLPEKPKRQPRGRQKRQMVDRETLSLF
jgi:hypothetical protein